MIIEKTALAALAAIAIVAPAAASAQPSYATQDEQIRGVVASVGDKYTIYVRDQRGYVDTVRLHDGTVINPTGLTLASGQSVTIAGRTDGRAFDANEIDTPYGIDDGGYAAVDVGPYPYYDSYPAYALSYPAYISLGFGFGGGFYGGGYYGGGYYGHGYYHGGYYGNGYYGHGYYGNGYGHGYYGSGGRYPLGGVRGSTGGYGHTSYGGSYGHASYGGSYRASGASAVRSSGGGGGGGSFHGGGGGHR